MRAIPAILVLAAGASSRMRGADKLLEEIDGLPLLLRAVRAACSVTPETIVALPPSSARRALLRDSPARIVEVPERAMSASIRAGVAACESAALMIHLADMPEIGAADLRTVARAWQETTGPTLRATSEDGRPGQPVVFDRTLFPALAVLSGDDGARSVLRAHPPALVALPETRALVDLDTPEAWVAWRAARSR
ncbi:nucleotidyltransferase family protein [uncultured Jannaschia sp.]|uniref:nucleotidyltransferase family protein n=1 Tax=uncultured Jannaschia sp. TaxID=293347 RepID=UPI00262F0DAE|nr:nucleotidyltransferase family protein [uncultured Jannaschia sp.]